jgi:hypothetical protein
MQAVFGLMGGHIFFSICHLTFTLFDKNHYFGLISTIFDK